MQAKYLKRIAEFFAIGVGLNIIDNIIAIRAVSTTAITPSMLWTVFVLTLPFAIISELIVDGKDIFRHHR